METYKKKYKEALKWIESIYTELNHERQMEAEAFFPEIKENEDERIKKWCISHFKECINVIKDNDEYKEYLSNKVIAWLEKQGEQKNEENTDFTIYYPLKNGKGKYESIPYSFYGTLTSFSENIDLINFLRNCFYSEEECEEWIKKQSEQKPTDKTAPKFKVSDIMRTLQEASDNITSGLPIIVSIDKEYYHCTNELIAIKDQDDYEYPPMNRTQNLTWSEEDVNMCESVIDVLFNNTMSGSKGREVYSEEIEWLESLKEKLTETKGGEI